MAEDFLSKFMFEDLPVKGSLVRLSSSWQEVMFRARPDPLTQSILGETLCASALLTSNIKFRGSVSLQIQSRGAIRLLLGQCTHEGKLRGVARMREQILSPLLEQAILSINLEPESGATPFQGIVEMESSGLVPTLERYFLQSEQLDTRFWLAAGTGHCSGLMLQKMPGTSLDSDGWNRLTHLASTISSTELHTCEPARLISSLFNQESVRLFTASEVTFGCSCSVRKVSGMLLALGHQEVMDLIEERGLVEVICEYCGKDYHFDRIDVGRLFAGESASLPTSTGVH